MTEKKKATAKYIVTSQHAIVGETGAPSATLAPGDRVPFNPDSDSHKYLERQIESGDPAYAHLSVVEIDHDAEAKAEEEKAEMLAKAEKIAAKQREQDAQAALERQEEITEASEKAAEEGSAGRPDTDFPPQDEEAQALAAADDEDKESKSGSRSTRRKS